MPASCSHVTSGLVLSRGVSGGDAPGIVGNIPAHGCLAEEWTVLV